MTLSSGADILSLFSETFHESIKHSQLLITTI